MRISFAALLLVACSGIGPQAIQTIGPSGGTLEADGLILTIPPGALDQEIEISIESELVDGQKHYHLGPDGLEFKLPVGVSLPFEPSDRASIILHDSRTHGTELVATNTDATTKRARGEILGFSEIYIIHVPAFDPPPGRDFRVVGMTTTSIALSWNYVFNTFFERWELRQSVRGRSFARRLAHGIGFEGGLVVILVPVMALWLDISLANAFMANLGLLAFFFFYAIAFTWIFDRVFGLPQSAAKHREA